MKVLFALLSLAASFAVNAAAISDSMGTSATQDNRNIDVDTAHTTASRFSCGQYKFQDGTVQEFYSQVWAGLPANEMVCRYFKYEFRDKKGQEGTMVAAKVDLGCTCFFYE